VSDLALVDEMLEIARKYGPRPDARIKRVAEWIRANMAPDGHWNNRRLVLFTEYEDTRRWVEKRLAEALDDLEPDDRIASFTGATPLERREELKRRFNADPAEDPLRILVCTDAAREGINLQRRCHDLIHIDLPWNPARLEQRNGRIDRKLQPSPKVWCRYFVYEQREEDIVLEALVRKTELIRTATSSRRVLTARRERSMIKVTASARDAFPFEAIRQSVSNHLAGGAELRDKRARSTARGFLSTP